MAHLHMHSWSVEQMRSEVLRQADTWITAGPFFTRCQMPGCTKRRPQLVSDISAREIETIIEDHAARLPEHHVMTKPPPPV